MEILKIISVHKKRWKNNPPPKGKKRVEATLKYKGEVYTRHVDVDISEIK